MDQARTGRFIAEARKKTGCTQKQLAEKLNISDKTVSKWECGNGFPEVSLLLPLCEALGVTVNDLLSGERVSGEDYQKKAEKNMVEMIQEREKNRRQFMLTLALGGVSLLAFITLLIVACLYTDVIALPVKIAMIAVACVIFAVGFLAVYEGQRKIGYYKCSKCGSAFIPAFGSYALSINMVSKRLLKCPGCGKRNFCEKVMGKDA